MAASTRWRCTMMAARWAIWAKSRLSAFVGGELIVYVGDATVLDGRGQTETAQLRAKEPITLAPGHYDFVVKFKSIKEAVAKFGRI